MFYLMALDKDFNMITPLYPINVQWNRKYHEPGSFSIQLPLNQYSESIKYIYTKDRPEMGKISQKNYAEENGCAFMQLSGYFFENELNRHVAYPAGIMNIKNSPSWIKQNRAAEDVAYAFFNGFKRITTDTFTSLLNISASESSGRGNKAVHTRNGEYLGVKVYDILKPSGLSYRVTYDLLENSSMFSVWGGKDLTQENADGNNPVIFSTKYGNLKDPNILIDETSYKNVCINAHEEDEKYLVRALNNAADDDAEYAFVYNESRERKSDYTNEEGVFQEAAFLEALDDESKNKLSSCEKTFNLEFNAESGSYVYMQDFDLGDKCDIEVSGVVQMEARLIACYEVIKAGEWSMSLEFGTPIIKKGGKH